MRYIERAFWLKSKFSRMHIYEDITINTEKSTNLNRRINKKLILTQSSDRTKLQGYTIGKNSSELGVADGD